MFNGGGNYFNNSSFSAILIILISLAALKALIRRFLFFIQDFQNLFILDALQHHNFS